MKILEVYEMLNNYQEEFRKRKIATPVPLPADCPIRRRTTRR
jgi:hypothetical protein